MPFMCLQRADKFMVGGEFVHVCQGDAAVDRFTDFFGQQPTAHRKPDEDFLRFTYRFSEFSSEIVNYQWVDGVIDALLEFGIVDSFRKTFGLMQSEVLLEKADEFE